MRDTLLTEGSPATNRRLAKVAVQCSADTFVVNQSLVLRIKICGKNRHLRQAPNRYGRWPKKELKKVTRHLLEAKIISVGKTSNAFNYFKKLITLSINNRLLQSSKSHNHLYITK